MEIQYRLSVRTGLVGRMKRLGRELQPAAIFILLYSTPVIAVCSLPCRFVQPKLPRGIYPFLVVQMRGYDPSKELFIGEKMDLI